MNDYRTLIELLEKYKEEAKRIFNKLKEANQEARTGILQYGRYSVFGKIEWDCFNENYITVRYYDDDYEYGYGYGSSTLIVPTGILFDDAKIDEWVKAKIEKAREEKEWEQKAAKKRQEEKERQEYERLKEKFGK